MNNLILDAGIAALVCVDNSSTDPKNSTLQKLIASDVKLWLYTGQALEIITRIQACLADDEQSKQSHKAAKLLTELATRCSWLAMLSEDVAGLTDDDPIHIGLTEAAKRLGEKTLIVTDVESRLAQGRPFIQLEEVSREVESNSQIPFIDLATQQDRIRPELERNLFRVLHHGQYVMGAEVEMLELRLAEYVGVEHCISVSSGTDALLIALMTLGVGQGDEVITTPFTFFAAVETIKLLGGIPVYVDIEPKSYNLDPELLEVRISDRTKAILPVSLYGLCPEMDRINEIADSHQIPVIEDAAQSFGAMYKGRRSCSLSQIGCTSFFPAKPFGAYGDAGACFTDDPDLAESMRQIRDHGQSARYQHYRLGLNGRMDTIQAAVLLAMLAVFDQELDSRADAARRYSELMESAEISQLLTLPTIEPYNFSSWAQYTIEVSDRNHVRSVLSDNGIPTAVHYPEPVYAQPALSEAVAHCPATEHAAKRVLSLPMHPYLELDTQKFVSRLLLKALES